MASSFIMQNSMVAQALANSTPSFLKWAGGVSHAGTSAPAPTPSTAGQGPSAYRAVRQAAPTDDTIFGLPKVAVIGGGIALAVAAVVILKKKKKKKR